MLVVVALEEHLVTRDVLDVLDRADPAVAAALSRAPELLDVGDGRRAAMAAAGVDVQVLSLTSPGLQDLAPAEARALQRATNDEIAAAVRTDPQHLQGFATLALGDPRAAADELVRAVTTLGLDGAMVFPRARGVWLDDDAMRPVLEVAAALRAPLYVHPQTPPAAVRAAYYGGFGDEVDAAFATHGLGWHHDTGVAFLRLVLSGALDRFPDLQLVLGHWGEQVLFFLERVQQLQAVAHLPRRLVDYVRDQVTVTPSGILSPAYARWASEVIGAERLAFAADHPFVPLAPGSARAFVAAADPDGVGLAGGAWARLRAGTKR